MTAEEKEKRKTARRKEEIKYNWIGFSIVIFVFLFWLAI